jgi:hypothetical protein
MRITVFLALFCYWVLLTVLLLVPNPAALLGLHAVPVFPWGKFGVHLGFFAVLGFLASAVRWPKGPGWPMTVFLMVYGPATEVLQRFVPHRHAAVIDAVEDILGIALGVAVYWLLQRLTQPLVEARLAANLLKPSREADAPQV